MKEVVRVLVQEHAKASAEKDVQQHVRVIAKELAKDLVRVAVKEHVKTCADNLHLAVAHALAPVKKRILALNPNNFNNNEKRLFRNSIPPRFLQKLRQVDIAHHGSISRKCDSCFCRRDTVYSHMHKRLHRFLQR